MKKKVLFFCPQFNNYDISLYNTIVELGYDTTFFNDQPQSIWFRKATKYSFIRTKFKTILLFFEILNSKIILMKVRRKKFDYVLVIKGAFLPYSFYKSLRKLNPKASFIMYQWDSHKNYCKTMRKDFLDNSKFFDKIFSFDRTDCENINGLEYLPLFYTKEFAELRNSKEENIAYDLFFLGAKHSNRLQVLEKLYNNLIGYSLRICFLLFNYRSNNSDFKTDGFKILSNAISRSDLISHLSKSNVVVDIHSSGQDGITIRTFEALAAGKKLATTNAMVLKESFYNPNNIYIFDENNPNIPLDFIKRNSEPIDMSYYSINSFIIKLLGNE
jgi:hypothetical protein